MDLFLGKVQRRLVVRPPRVNDHPVQFTALLDNLIHRRRDGGLLGDVGLEAFELSGPPLLCSGKLVAGIGVIDRVDDTGAIVEAGLCDAETDATVSAGNYDEY